MKQNSKILIIGGAGFIGTNLCRKLIDLGHRITIIDNCVTGSMENVPDRATFIPVDICRCGVPDCDYDYVFHLASIASPKYYLRYPLEAMDVAYTGTKNALEIARKCHAKFIFTSTSEIYGESMKFPQSEDDAGRVDPNSPRAVYSESKRVAETLISEYRRSYNVDTKILRIFNTFGPFMDINDGRVVPNFISQALSKKPLTIYGDGTQTRSFLYIDDLISAIIMILDIDYSGPINIGGEDEIAIRELGQMIYDMVNRKADPKYRFHPVQPDDPSRRLPDISLIKSLTGWRPQISLKEGLLKYIEWLRS